MFANLCKYILLKVHGQYNMKISKRTLYTSKHEDSVCIYINGCALDFCACGCKEKKMKEAGGRGGRDDDERGARASSLDIVVRRARREPVGADRCHTTAGRAWGSCKEFVLHRRHKFFRESCDLSSEAFRFRQSSGTLGDELARPQDDRTDEREISGRFGHSGRLFRHSLAENFLPHVPRLCGTDNDDDTTESSAVQRSTTRSVNIFNNMIHSSTFTSSFH